MKRDNNLFQGEEEFQKFLKNSIIQYIKLKFQNKKGLISFIENKLDIKIPKTANYTKITDILKEKSKDFYTDMLKVHSPLEIAHLYSFYRMLIDIFWETTWIKTFSPFYKFLFNEEPEIKNKSDQRKYAAKIITELSQQELQKKWIEYSSEPFPFLFGETTTPVIHYEHLTIGPLGFLFSLHYREKEIFGSYEPVLSILVNTTPTGEDIFDWEETDAFKVFSDILKELNRKINEVTSSYPLYANYLKSIGFEFPYSEWENQLLNFVKLFKNQIKEDRIPPMFYQMVQLTAMFFTDEEIIDLLNRLLAEEKLIVKSETEIEDLKIMGEGIVKRPKSWLARPAFELASDIASIKSKEFRDLLTDVLENGTIKYLEQVFDKDFETFRRICIKKKLYKFASLEKYRIPKKKAIRLVLESYGLRTPSTLPLDIRGEINSYIEEIQKFEEECETMEERELIKEIIDLLRDGRMHFERILKEWVFIIISLILHYENSVARGLSSNIFLLDWPIFYISYDIERKLNEIKKKYREFLEKLTSEFNTSGNLRIKIDNYIKKERIEFTLGDWLSLLQLSVRYADENLSNRFWSALPAHFYKNVRKSISEIESFLNEGGALKLLNLASHERAIREFQENIRSRQEALNMLPKLRENILSELQRLPELIIITKEVTDGQTGLKYYEARLTTNKSIKIYGTQFVELNFPYYLIPRFEKEEDIATYPIIITNLTDNVF